MIIDCVTGVCLLFCDCLDGLAALDRVICRTARHSESARLLKLFRGLTARLICGNELRQSSNGKGLLAGKTCLIHSWSRGYRGGEACLEPGPVRSHWLLAAARWAPRAMGAIDWRHAAWKGLSHHALPYATEDDAIASQDALGIPHNSRCLATLRNNYHT